MSGGTDPIWPGSFEIGLPMQNGSVSGWYSITATTKKPSTTAPSSGETELVAALSSACEGVGLQCQRWRPSSLEVLTCSRTEHVPATAIRIIQRKNWLMEASKLGWRCRTAVRAALHRGFETSSSKYASCNNGVPDLKFSMCATSMFEVRV